MRGQEQTRRARNSFLPKAIKSISLAMRIPRLAFLVLLLTFIAAPGAWAHAHLLRAEPKSGAELSSAPKQIDLWFNELLEADFNTVTVLPAADLAAGKKTNFAKAKPALDARDHTHLTIQLEPLPPGEYVIEWRVLSRDGHSAPGRSTFRLRSHP
jgi:methionine-rich copper-binding protein CopC